MKSGFLAGLLILLVASPSFAQHGRQTRDETILYVWASDQARVAPDFLAVIDFDERSRTYGSVITTVPLPPPGNAGNEPHHCHLSANQRILACGGLLSLLKGQNGIFFFDVTEARHPRFLMSAKALDSSITDDFYPLPEGGFLITQMGSATGLAPGRVAEFDGRLRFVGNHFGEVSMFRELPSEPPLDGFNPHGLAVRPELNLMLTSDFILPSSTLAGSNGPVLRNTVRVWDYYSRKITNTIRVMSPGGSPALGLMDVKLLPNDPNGTGYTIGMFDGFLYKLDPKNATAAPAFDFATVMPHIDSPVRGGMGQIMATPKRGDRLIVPLFGTGQVIMLDATDRSNLRQIPEAVVSLGRDAGPHNIELTEDDSRLVVVGYFLNQDDAGIIHFDGDHKVRVLKVGRDSLVEDKRFNLDFNNAFPTGPARPHGIAMK
jgi:selenium-binding protein 1